MKKEIINVKLKELIIMVNKYHMEIQIGIKDGNHHIITNLIVSLEMQFVDLLLKKITKPKLHNGKNKVKSHNQYLENGEKKII
jgi:hypothetical protein